MKIHLDIPVAEIAIDVHTPRRFAVVLDGGQAQTLKRLAVGLEEAGAMLGNGALVRSGDRALAWLLDAISTAKPAV